jgi:AmmeMemoRadiSam system protein B
MCGMKVRAAAVAGTFYSADPRQLAREVDQYLAAGLARLRGSIGAIKAVIAPHAGYRYSGPIAGTVYAALSAQAPGIRRVVLLGPAHRVHVSGLAASAAEAFATPLGEVPVDRAAIIGTLRRRHVRIFDAAHATEHSLEVQLPFLQRLLGEFTLVPLAVGAADHAAVADVLDDLWGGPETLIVISSDLSHYYDYDTARRLDGETAAAIESLRPDLLGPESACGRVPVGGLLVAAQRRGLRARQVDLRNSGDTAGSAGEVVGYGGFVLS